MEAERRFELTPRLFLGLALLAVGALLTLENLRILDDAEDVLRFWPVLLVAVGLNRLLQKPRRGARLGSVLLIVVGIWLTLWELEWTRWGWEEIWPLLLVIFGTVLIWEAVFRTGRRQVPVETESTFHTLAVWSGIERKLSTSDFRSGEAVAIMGGASIDLRGAMIAGGQAEIFVLAWWGGVDLLVPEDWAVTNRTFALLGGVDDHTHPPRGGSEQRLIVRGLAVMGGVDISNHPTGEA